jgi:multidrug transporter EmrE-like cation transporter
MKIRKLVIYWICSMMFACSFVVLDMGLKDKLQYAYSLFLGINFTAGIIAGANLIREEHEKSE